MTAVRHQYENTMAANLREDDRKERTWERKEKKFADNDWKGLIEETNADSFLCVRWTSTSKDIISH